jgi:hypothetical protein
VFLSGGLTLAFEDTLERTIAALEVPSHRRAVEVDPRLRPTSSLP